MKNTNNKTLVFYHFQLSSSKELNVTSIPNKPNNTPFTIKDVLLSLPIDLSQGLYHFRFKCEMPEGNQKILAWIDINNLAAKVPQVNGSVFVKILNVQNTQMNKLFHIEKLRKADIVQTKNGITSLPPKNAHPHTARPHSEQPHPVQPRPAQPTNPQMNKNPSNNTNNTNNANSRPNPPPQGQSRTPNAPTNPSKTPQPVQVPKNPTATKADSLLGMDSPKKPGGLSQQIQQNLDTFKDQFTAEQLKKQNQRLASQELEQKIRKWGYTDMKKINNLTTLLATLHEIWPEWGAVSLTDMLKPEQVNSVFKKAVIKVHPDKNRDRHFKEQYLSKRVFELLNEARKQK